MTAPAARIETLLAERLAAELGERATAEALHGRWSRAG